AVWGSPGPLTQVIATLIENALVHGEGNTSVKVRRNDHSTVVEVTDEGGGIDPELGASIFERSVSGSSSGTGVGLALARTLVEDTDAGAGIAPALGASILERSVSGSASGTGVGLALARTLVEDDGGRLELPTEIPPTFGVFLISAPGEEDPGEDEAGAHDEPP